VNSLLQEYIVQVVWTLLLALVLVQFILETLRKIIMEETSWDYLSFKD